LTFPQHPLSPSSDVPIPAKGIRKASATPSAELRTDTVQSNKANEVNSHSLGEHGFSRAAPPPLTRRLQPLKSPLQNQLRPLPKTHHPFLLAEPAV
jgi:hypothetical protein